MQTTTVPKMGALESHARETLYNLPIPVYSKPASQAYKLILRSTDRESWSTNDNAVFHMRWDKALDRDKNYHMVVESFYVNEAVADATLPDELYTISISDNFDNIYSSQQQGCTSAIVLAKGGAFTTPNQTVGGLLRTPQQMMASELHISFKRAFEAAAPTAIAEPNNKWVMTLLIFPYD